MGSMKEITIGQYRAIDLSLMAVIVFVFEMLTVLAAGWFPMESYTLSPTTLMLCIVMMRWDGFAAIHAAVAGLAFCIVQGAEPKQFIVYCVGNCFALAGLAYLKILGKEKVRNKLLLSVLFVVIVFSFLQIGRWLMSIAMGGAADTLLSFFLADILSLPFGAVGIFIARRMDGLYEDQKAYLIRTEEERKRQRNLDNFE